MRNRLLELARKRLQLPIDIEYVDSEKSKNKIITRTSLPWGWYNPKNIGTDDHCHEVQIIVSHEGKDYEEDDILVALAHELGHCIQYEEAYGSRYDVYNMANIFTHGNHENMAWDFGYNLILKLENDLGAQYMDAWMIYSKDWRHPVKQANFILRCLETLGIAEINRENMVRAFRLVRNEEEIETT